MVIGHRGAKGLCFENSLESILKAIDIGADAVEFDQQSTKDHKLVLHHDETLSRMYGIDASIKDKTLKQLKDLTKNHKNPICSFSEVMQKIGNFPVCVELKYDPITVNLFAKRGSESTKYQHHKSYILRKRYFATLQRNGGGTANISSPFKEKLLLHTFCRKKHRRKWCRPALQFGFFAPTSFVV